MESQDNNTLEYPMILKTREDYEFIIKNFPREKWEVDVQKLIIDAMDTRIVGVMDNKISNYNEKTVTFHKRDYVHNYKKIIKKMLIKNHLEVNENFETVFTCKDGSELRKYEMDKSHLYHTKIIYNPESKLFKIGFTVDELMAITMGILDPSMRSQMKDLEKQEKELQNAIDKLETQEKEEENNGSSDSE